MKSCLQATSNFSVGAVSCTTIIDWRAFGGLGSTRPSTELPHSLALHEARLFSFCFPGDPNVPAGEVSFTANIDRGARLDPSGYPDMLGVTARYAGKGLIAQPGFAEPKCAILYTKCKCINRNGKENKQIWKRVRVPEHARRHGTLLRASWRSPASPSPSA